MAKTDDYDQREDLGWLRDELRQRDRLIAELRREQDEANDLIRRFREHAEDYDATIDVREINRRWIDQNPDGHRDWRAIAPRINDECIRRILVEQLQHEEYFLPIFVYLDRELSALGWDADAGGSVQRRVCVLLGELSGASKSEYSAYIEHSTVRVGLDLLANEIAKRCADAHDAS